MKTQTCNPGPGLARFLETHAPELAWRKRAAKRREDRTRARQRAARAVLADLEHYAATHGPGPDVRLEAFKKAFGF